MGIDRPRGAEDGPAERLGHERFSPESDRLIQAGGEGDALRQRAERWLRQGYAAHVGASYDWRQAGTAWAESDADGRHAFDASPSRPGSTADGAGQPRPEGRDLADGKDPVGDEQAPLEWLRGDPGPGRGEVRNRRHVVLLRIFGPAKIAELNSAEWRAAGFVAFIPRRYLLVGDGGGALCICTRDGDEARCGGPTSTRQASTRRKSHMRRS
jgi:hypothetical protein